MLCNSSAGMQLFTLRASRHPQRHLVHGGSWFEYVISLNNHYMWLGIACQVYDELTTELFHYK